MRSKLLVLAAVCLYATPAYAYLDPGVGSALLYVVVAVALSGYYGARSFGQRVAELIFRSRYKQQACNVALHSEHPRYEITFLPIMRGLSERGIAFTYFTMYERGEEAEPLPEGGSHRAIPDGLVGYSLLNNLSAKILVTTTPQLDVMMFRRSKRVKHYCYVQHGLGESLYLRPFAYDYFDTVLSCGKTLEENIRTIEGIRGLPQKRLRPTGVPHFDELLKGANAAAAAAVALPLKERPMVLVAPSWGTLSLFSLFGTDFVRTLSLHFDVVVRPHPQMKISQAALYGEILAMEGVRVDTAPTPADIMERADILVSDFSGITHEFAFIYEKPVVVVDHGLSTEAFEGHLLGGKSRLKESCSEFIIPLQPSQMGNLAEHVQTALENHDPERIAKTRAELVHHFGAAGPRAAEHLEEILQCL